MPDLLAPNERLSGRPEHRSYLQHQLTAIRTAPALSLAHLELAFLKMAELIAVQAESPGMKLLRAGMEATERRYHQLGLTSLLPPERVWVGIASTSLGAFGGFHYPDQGYRHWQMAAIITRYGSLAQPRPISSPLEALDLIRAYLSLIHI